MVDLLMFSGGGGATAHRDTVGLGIVGSVIAIVFVRAGVWVGVGAWGWAEAGVEASVAAVRGADVAASRAEAEMAAARTAEGALF